MVFNQPQRTTGQTGYQGKKKDGSLHNVPLGH
jgi:hypothetical protein